MPTKRLICSNVLRPNTPRARNCEKPARWQFWDGARPPLDTVLYSCAGCLSANLDPDIFFNVVQRIEY